MKLINKHLIFIMKRFKLINVRTRELMYTDTKDMSRTYSIMIPRTFQGHSQ